MPGSRPAASGGCQQAAVPDDEEVGLGALDDLAGLIAHQRLVGAALERLLHRQRVVQEVVALDHRVERERMVCAAR
jgi:hypothetical protein